MESGSIITIVALDDENQAFEFTGKIKDIRDDSIIMSVIYGNALEHRNSPFIAKEPEPHMDSYDFTVDMLLFKQFLKYRLQGFDIEKCLKWMYEDREFIDEKF